MELLGGDEVGGEEAAGEGGHCGVDDEGGSEGLKTRRSCPGERAEDGDCSHLEVGKMKSGKNIFEDALLSLGQTRPRCPSAEGLKCRDRGHGCSVVVGVTFDKEACRK